MTEAPSGVVLVIDGLGIGAMPDVPHSRPQDTGADTLARVRAAGSLLLPALDGLGLAAAAGGGATPEIVGRWGRASLGYEGADSYMGHLELMGGDLSGIRVEPFGVARARYAAAFRAAGHSVRDVGTALLLDEAVLVGDSLEADLGLNYNVTGCLPLVPWTTIIGLAEQLRGLAPVSRIIAVGGTAIGRDELLASVHERDGASGVDTRELGVYRTGVEIRHLGAPIDAAGQLHLAAAARGRSVLLVGKAADLLPGDGMDRLPAVDTGEVLAATLDAVGDRTHDLVVANVQQTDLAGHQADAAWFARLLGQVDEAVSTLLERQRPSDLLVVTSDHGNDPGHGSRHTRERVPVLAHAPGVGGGPIGDRSTLADVGATVAAWLGLPEDPAGRTFIEPSALPRPWG